MARKRVRKKQAPARPEARLTLKPAWELALLTLAILATYFHTLDVPFYMDDHTSIQNNASIRSLDLGQLWQFSSARVVGYLSFALNYAWGGLDVGGYHLVNILVHVLCAVLVWLVTRTLLRLPNAGQLPDAARKWLPLVVALLFALHPLQTQAVTYTVQRLASLTALFYFTSLYAYLNFRLADGRRLKILYLCLALAAALLAGFTKQNAVTLPAAIVLLELCFFNFQKNYHLALAGLAGLLLTAIIAFGAANGFTALFADISSATRDTELLTRTQYLALQMQVLWLYIGKFLLPVDLRLIYDLAIPDNTWNVTVLLATAAHLLLAGTAFRYRRSCPLVAFAILFFYLAHSIESGVIPIRDFVFEHRTYLPNLGLCLLAGWLFTVVMPRFISRQYVTGALVLILAALAVTTFVRNNQWRDQIAFFEREVALSPDSFRVLNHLGEAYYVNGRPQDAVRIFERAQPLYASRIVRDNNMEEAYFTNFAATLQETGDFARANALIDNLLERDISPAMEARLRVTRGNIHALGSRLAEAEAEFNRARELAPADPGAVASLAKLRLVQNRFEESEDLFRLLAELDPGNRDAMIGLEFLRER